MDLNFHNTIIQILHCECIPMDFHIVNVISIYIVEHDRVVNAVDARLLNNMLR